ncbi:uncharacterized protein A4U43_C04F8710 [Asparagus officinalis]|uniref:Uncharacterized protein n=1 Tax=Asparagus officinalis TaxID=4686 RepID=A0A5P1EZS8_ASPOF|nr:uncharacterized protein A4U43_C04F8710 [Asparagus officinalis]
MIKFTIIAVSTVAQSNVNAASDHLINETPPPPPTPTPTRPFPFPTVKNEGIHVKYDSAETQLHLPPQPAVDLDAEQQKPAFSSCCAPPPSTRTRARRAVEDGDQTAANRGGPGTGWAMAWGRAAVAVRSISVHRRRRTPARVRRPRPVRVRRPRSSSPSSSSRQPQFVVLRPARFVQIGVAARPHRFAVIPREALHSDFVQLEFIFDELLRRARALRLRHQILLRSLVLRLRHR